MQTDLTDQGHILEVHKREQSKDQLQDSCTLPKHRVDVVLCLSRSSLPHPEVSSLRLCLLRHQLMYSSLPGWCGALTTFTVQGLRKLDVTVAMIASCAKALPISQIDIERRQHHYIHVKLEGVCPVDNRPYTN